MNPNCNSIQELLAAESSMERPWSAPLEEHLQGCAQCEAFAARMGWTMNALRDLQLVGAPAELHGRVVSACQAGFAEDRAVGEIGNLPLMGAPHQLDLEMLRVFEEIEAEGVLERGVQAPRVLEERVAKDLADLPGALSRRALEKLPRLATPELLADRLDRELPTGAPQLRSLGPVGRWTTAAASIAAAAGLLWMINGVLNPSFPTEPGLAFVSPGDEVPSPESSLSFEVVHPTELSQLSGQARALATQLSGGLDLSAASANRVSVPNQGPNEGTVPTDPRGSGQEDLTGGSGSSGGIASGGTSTGAGPSGGLQSGTTSTQGGPAYFASTADAPFIQAYRGVREVTIHADYLGMSSQLVYLEEVASDGAGSFTIDPLQVITPVMDSFDEDRFLLYQNGRKNFFFQHRDFRVRNGMRFLENYSVQDLGITQVIAGRPCETLLISRLDGVGNNFTVAIDPLTSLVMQERRSAKDGSLVSSVEYKSFALNADLSDLQLGSTQSLWTTTDVDSLSSIVSGELMIPVAPPKGFELLSVGYRTNAGLSQDQTWVQLTYGDGVEQAFFLFRQEPVSQGNAGPQTQPGGMGEDLVRSMTVGPWSILDGRAGGREVVAAGRVSEGDLLLMLQSSLD